MFNRISFVMLCAMPLWMGTVAHAEQAAPAQKKKASKDKVKSSESLSDSESRAAKSKPNKSQAVKSQRVAGEPFKIEIEIDGTFEAVETKEISLQPEKWTNFVVVRAVEAGTAVKQNDPLLWLETKEIDDTIRDLETEHEIAQLQLARTEEEIRLLEESARLDLAAAERAKRTAAEDLAYFHETERPLAEKSADFSLKFTANSLDYRREELRQLESMYKADDLTEETEEIILKRARDQVESSEFSHARSKIYHEQTHNIQLPRREEALHEAAQKLTLALEQERVTAPIQLRIKQLELDQLKQEQMKTDEKLQHLRNDLEAMVVRSPSDGIVYYGSCLRGKWSGASAAESTLRPEGRVSPHDVFMTIVKPDALRVRASVDEKYLAHLQPGLKGTVTPTGFPKSKLTANLESLSLIPAIGSHFDATISVDAASVPTLAAGMTCKIKFVPYARRGAVVVPESAIFTDDLDEQKQYVFVQDKAGDHQQRSVEVGQTVDKKSEILSGLKIGETILLERPKTESNK